MQGVKSLCAVSVVLIAGVVYSILMASQLRISRQLIGPHASALKARHPSIALATLFRHQNHFGVHEGKEAEAVECFGSSKLEYAKRWGYEYFDETDFPVDESLLLPYYDDWMTKALENKGRYDKLRFLIYLLETHQEIAWFLWLDADAFITDFSVKLEERLTTLLQLTGHVNNDTDWQAAHNTSIVLGIDMNGWNNGVFFIRNSPLARHILHAAYATPVPPTDMTADQYAMRKMLQGQVYTKELLNSVAVLRPDQFSVLQGYLRLSGEEIPPQFRWQQGDFILHMPACPWEMRAQAIVENELCDLSEE